ncbi:9729_t:CDS:1, partial [Funneliformis geosporum]
GEKMNLENSQSIVSQLENFSFFSLKSLKSMEFIQNYRYNIYDFEKTSI